MGTRFLVAGVLLAAWMRWRGARWPSRREWANATVLGTLMLAVAYGLTAVAEQTVSSGLVVAFIAIGPALQAGFEWPYGIRPTRIEAAGIALGLVGVLGLAVGQAFSAFMVLLQRTPTAVSASYAYVNPVIALLLGVTLGGETLAPGEWLAAALVTASVVLMLRGRPS